MEWGLLSLKHFESVPHVVDVLSVDVGIADVVVV